MRTIDEYMKLPYKAEIIPDLEEGGYVASYPELVGCITCGDTMESAVANLEDAKTAERSLQRQRQREAPPYRKKRKSLFVRAA